MANDLPKALAEWAVKEMGFRLSENHDAAETLKNLNLSGICLGPMEDIWSYVIKNLKSESNIKTMRGNLQLHSGIQGIQAPEDSKTAALVKEREKLKKEIAELKKNNQLLDDNITETKTAIEERQLENLKQKLAFRDEKRSAYFLGLVQNNIKGQVKEVNQFSSEIDRSMESLVPKMEKENNLDRYKIDIQQLCEAMQSSLTELLEEQPNYEVIETTKKKVGSKLSDLLDTLPPSVFLKLMQEQVESDISGFKSGKPIPLFQQDEMDKLENPLEEVQPLQKLLYNIAWVYADSCSRAKKAKLKADSLKDELEKAKSEATQMVKNHFIGDNHNLNAALKTMELKVHTACQQAAIVVLNKNIEELQNFCTQHEANQAQVAKQIQNIERNSNLSEHLSTLILTLARKHSNYPQVIEQTTNRLQKIVKEDLHSLFNVLLNDIAKSKGGLEKELELYTQLKPSQLFTVNIDKVPVHVNRLAMNRFLPLTTEPGVSDICLEKTLKNLGLHRQVPVFHVFETISSKRSEIRRRQLAIEFYQTRQSEIVEKYGTAWVEKGIVRYKELAKKLQEKREVQEAKLLPELEQRMKMMEEASQLTSEVETALKEWYEEPAKLIDTGRTVNDLTLEQWRHVWSQSLNKCRKKT